MNKLLEIVEQRKKVITDKWFKTILDSYPIDAAEFLRREKDRFNNPVGYTISQSVQQLLDQMLDEMEPGKITEALDDIIRIRSVQDFSPSQAVSFIFSLKKIILEDLTKESGEDINLNDFFLIESRIDRIALLAFELYSKNKEKIFEIRVSEIKKWSARLIDQVNSTDRIVKKIGTE